MTTPLRYLTSALLLALATMPLMAEEARYPQITALGPVGFWPADEGEGNMLENLGEGARDALLFNTGWDQGVLSFDAGFQFIEFPRHPATASEQFSIGTWVFVRRPRAGRHSDRRATYLLGTWGRHWRDLPGPISIQLTGPETRSVEVVSDGKRDAVGSLEAGVEVAPETWQHLLYTYSEGVGTLYVNGKAVATQTDIPYTPRVGEFIAGADSNWWAVHPPRSEALDGSLAQIVFFDRALAADEAATLAADAPTTAPHVLAADELRLHGAFIRLDALAELPAEDQRQALHHMHKKHRGWVGDYAENADTLRPYLRAALEQPLLRYDAAMLLQKHREHAILAEAVPQLIATLEAADAAPKNRATAARVLGLIGKPAAPAVPRLMELLRNDLATNGSHVPRVEAGLRNALITALLDIAPDDPDARGVLGDTLAKPILDSFDLTQPYMAEVRALVAEKRYMDALDASKPIIKEQKLYFRSQGDPARDQRDHWSPNDRAYTPVTTYNGYTYIFGNAESFDGAEQISQADYDRAIAAYSPDFPEAKDWMDGKVEGLFRADLKRVAPDGTVETAYIGGENFIFSGRDLKTKGWSVAVDTDGYIHVMGGQHNSPRHTEYMPGAWQSLGLSADRRDPKYPTVMYFVSKRPEDISEFEFLGREGEARDIPVPFMNYMNFVQDRDGELYLYGRNDSGIQNWAAYHYDTETRRWRDLGGPRVDIFTDIRQADPAWIESVEYVWVYCFRGNIPTGKGPSEHGTEYPSVCWAWQPFFYNYCRSTRGLQWDPENRLYIEVPILGYDARRRISESNQFVYSDDGGQTFHRADGSPVKLPLTNNPAPHHNANSAVGYSGLYYDQWQALIRRVGFIF